MFKSFQSTSFAEYNQKVEREVSFETSKCEENGKYSRIKLRYEEVRLGLQVH